MKNKIRRVVQICMGSSVGVFIGHSLWLWQDVNRYPELYAMDSAPWYVRLIIPGAVTAAVLIVGGIAWWMLGREKKENR